MRQLLVFKYPSKIAILYIASVILLLHLMSCAGIPISYYDSTTYTHLTSLKVETTMLIESFDIKPYSENQKNIEETTMELNKAYEYEKGKGDPNSDTTKQFSKIHSLFLNDIKEYKENQPGELGKKYFQEAAKTLGQAFDIAISTESLKNKDKQ